MLNFENISAANHYATDFFFLPNFTFTAQKSKAVFKPYFHKQKKRLNHLY